MLVRCRLAKIAAFFIHTHIHTRTNICMGMCTCRRWWAVGWAGPCISGGMKVSSDGCCPSRREQRCACTWTRYTRVLVCEHVRPISCCCVARDDRCGPARTSHLLRMSTPTHSIRCAIPRVSMLTHSTRFESMQTNKAKMSMWVNDCTTRSTPVDPAETPLSGQSCAWVLQYDACK